MDAVLTRIELSVQLEKIMRSLICLIAVLMITAPVMATVNFTVTGAGQQVTIGYTSDPCDSVRGVALLVTCSTGNKMNTVDSIATAFNTYIDYAYDDPCAYTVGSGALTDAIAKHDGPGVDATRILPSVICMGVLDESAGQASGPGSTDNLITFTMDNSLTNTITIAADTLRSETGAVGSDLDTNLPITIQLPASTDCLDIGTDPSFDYWVAQGKPDCWCYPRQCHGDANGTSTGSAFAGYVYVGVPDLDIMAPAFGVKEDPKGPGISGIQVCADFDHDQTGSAFAGYVRVGVPDLNALALYFGVKEDPKGPGTPPDCPYILEYIEP